MNISLELLMAIITGLVTGVIFFGGLWWTVQRGLQSTRPAMVFLASFVVRAGLAMAGFYFAGAGDWRNFTACLAGFIAGRYLVQFRISHPARQTGDS